MKQCIALALLVCLGASGCAQSGMMGCGDACHVATNRRAPRPTLFRDGSRPNARGFAKDLCGDGGCPVGAAMGCNCEGCACGGPCQRLAERVATGFCGCPGGGICPTGGGVYPEQPAFNQGPPVGQVAYPYYTTRGPRDFLLDNPPSIGPR